MLLTVVVVASRHQAWIRLCLRSILDQPTTDVEVVVVDNASPDHTPRIVTEAIGDDARVKVHRLEDRVDPSSARQLGIEMARGDYVWVLEPVDEMLPSALKLVTGGLAERPDVLLVPWLRRDLYGGERPPTHGLGARPLLRDRVVRRRHLVSSARVSSTGFAEVPVATSVLARAATVSRLDEPVVTHRELPARVRRSWASDDPFEVFAAYDAAFQVLDDASADRRSKADLAVSMLEHERTLLDDLGAARRREFFHAMSRSAVQRRALLPRPSGRVARAERRAIERDAYAVFSAVQRRRLMSARRLRKALRGVPRSRKALRARAVRVLYTLDRRRPLVANLAVYSAYWGKAYSCNPRAIFEKARELVPEIRGVWVVHPGSRGVLPPDVPYVVEGSRDYYRLMATATYFVNNANFANDIVKRPGQVHLQTHHGTPLKRMGLDLVHAPHSSMGLNFPRLMKRIERWDYSISANEFTTEIWERVYPSGTYESLETGYPRNDVLVAPSAAHRDRVRAELGLEAHQKAILYTPTHREYTKEYIPLLDVDALVAALGPEYVVLLRTHYLYASSSDLTTSDRARDVASHPSIEDLAIASDVLVTDYSSLMFDYAVLDQPIVIYAPDWETYSTERGTYFDLPAEPPGPVAMTQKALEDVFTSGAAFGEDSTRLRSAFRARFCALEDGHAAERVVRRLWPAGAPAARTRAAG